MVGGDGSHVNFPVTLLTSNQLNTTVPFQSAPILSNFNQMTADPDVLRLLQSQHGNLLSGDAPRAFIPHAGLPLPWNANSSLMNVMLNSFPPLTHSVLSQTVIPERAHWNQPSTSGSKNNSTDDGADGVCHTDGGPIYQNLEDLREGHMHSPGLPIHPYFPSHFLRGTHIQVDRNNTKLVEDLKEEDFYQVQSIASAVHDLDMQAGTVKAMECISDPVQVMITFEIEGAESNGDAEVSICDLKVPVEYPLFELTKGWCSFNPAKTVNLYGIDAKQLKVDDRCIVLTGFEDGSRSYHAS